MHDDWTPDRVAGLFGSLAEQLPDAVALRHELHAEPRVGGDETDTTRVLLDALDMDHELMPTGGAVVRVGAATGPTIGLRAELDALRVVERTEAPWRSRNQAMHACGHDVHMAAAVAVTRTLASVGAPVPLLLLLQPREEMLPSGALDTRESAAFRAHDVGAVVGVHLQPRLPRGRFAASGGAVNAAADQFVIVVNGRPGHAAYPHLTADPVVAAADLVGTLQHLVSRRVDPTNPTVLTIGTIEGGKSHNVVPASVRMSGILRTFDEQDRARLHRAIEDISASVASIHGCTAEVTVSLGAPVLDNDPALATTAAAWIEHAGLVPAAPHRSCGADDFSYYCAAAPSLMVFVGVGTGGHDQPGLHHPLFLPPDESVGEVATAMLAAYLGACETLVDLDLPSAETFRRHVRQ